MLELPLISLDIVRGAIQNLTIIATLILLYNFIPNTLLSRSRMSFSVCLGIMFSLAAALSIPALWQTSGAPVLGFNIILVPLAGFIGGPVSSLFVAAILLLGSTLSPGSLSPTDILTVLTGILLGAFFYAGRSWDRFPRSYLVQLILLGIGIALIEAVTVVFSFAPGTSPGTQSISSQLIPVFPFALISCGGTIILGYIIEFIDRRRKAEMELLDTRNHLEELVKKRTLELRKASSLQKATIESTADAIVVVDREGIIRAYNQKASHILNLPGTLPAKFGGAGIFFDAAMACISDPEEFLRLVTPLSESAEQIITTNLEFKNGRIYEVFVQPQHIGDNILGRVWSFHDITDQRRVEDAMKITNSKLVLLSNITRHDILNQMTVVSGYLELFRESVRDPADARRVEIMRQSLEIMRLQIEFTRDYQDVGMAKPVWRSVATAFLTTTEAFADRKIEFLCGTGDLEIYADPMIDRVFHNLIDNSIRHGERVTEIRLSAKTDEPDLVLLYEDNGVGVPPEEKEKIFRKGFGKHTGLGMFLIREILSITGITIRENGMAGQGIRFEIRVPSGKSRFP